MQRALITGICGFTGHYLAQELISCDCHVAGIAHSSSSSSVPGVSVLYQADLLNSNEIHNILLQEQPDVVIHLAAISFVAHGNLEDIYRVNLIGTHHLLNAVAQLKNPPHTLLASSANIYGNASAEIINEEYPPAPTNDYAVSKLAMEYMAKLWSERIPLTLVRPFNYTGVGQQEFFLIPKIVKHFANRAPVLELGNMDVERDFSDVRDVASIYRRLSELPGKGITYNICSGHGYILLSIIDMMEEISGYRPELKVNPAFVRSNEIKCLIGNNQRLMQAIGKQPTIGLKDTLTWMWQSNTFKK